MAAPDDMDYTFAKPIPDQFICLICLSVLKQPQMVNCCEKCYCKDCLQRWKRKNETCPNCRCSDYSFMDMPRISAKIGILEVFCPNRHYGCLETMAMRDCNFHLSEHNQGGCHFVKLLCPDACGEDIFRKDMTEHCHNMCPKRKIKCLHCDLLGEHLFISYQHMEECQLLPLSCPNNCGVTVARTNMESHKNSCPLELVPCLFRETGCHVTIHRKDIENHLEDSLGKHLTLLSVAHMSLKNDHMILRKEHNSLTKDHKTLQEKYSELQEAQVLLENKLYNAGRIINEIPSYTDALQRSQAPLFSLQQLSTVLVDMSTQNIGDTITLALSSSAGGGTHQFIVDTFTFQLEWSYVLRKLDIKLFLIISDSVHLPPTWNCDFIMKVQPHPMDITRAARLATHPVKVFSQPNSTAMPNSCIATTQILAVMCCGKPQINKDLSQTEKKLLIGPVRTIMTCIDVILILSLQHHVHHLSYLPPASQSMGTPFGTPFNVAQVFTCPCTCHGNVQTNSPLLVSRRGSVSAKKLTSRRKATTEFN